MKETKDFHLLTAEEALAAQRHREENPTTEDLLKKILATLQEK